MRWWWCHSLIFGGGYLYFQTILSLRLVRCWFPCQRWGWWMWWCAPTCLWTFWAISATCWCEGVALCLDINSRVLIIQVTWSGGHWHENSGHELKLWISSFSLDAKAHARKLRNYGACITCVWSIMSWRPVLLPPTDSFANVETLPTWEKVLTILIKPPDWQFKGWSLTATA